MRVAVVLPFYKKILSAFEHTSYIQLNCILRHYPIIFVIPENLYSYFVTTYHHRIELFPDNYFQSTATYSQLLLSPLFYRRFSDYEYILIYQLDAFVFSDKLEYFCSLEYDYIGAPLSRWTKYWCDIGAQVGNGGLSLRKTEAMLRVLRDREAILSNHPLAEVFLKYEDLFFGYCGKIGELKVPDVATALKFAIDDDVRHCYKNFERKLPFGCHGWYREKYAICKAAIEQCGYNLPEANPNFDPDYNRKNYIGEYLLRRLLRKSNQQTAICIIKAVLPYGDYAVWGLGKEGKFLYKLLQFAQIKISCIFERNIFVASDFQGIPVYMPVTDTLLLYKEKLLLGSDKYELEMVQYLTEVAGFHEGDWVTLGSLKTDICVRYIKLLCSAPPVERNVEVLS